MAAPERRVVRFGPTERALHWVHASAFLALLGSGLCLYLPSLAEAVGRRPLLKDVHVYTGLAWISALALVVLSGDRRRLLATAREIDRFNGRGRFNTGQKVNAILSAALAVLFAVTGFFLWYGERDHAFRLSNALIVHDWLTYVAIFLLVGHLYLALVHPSTRHSLSGITRGWVRENWARRHHPDWANEWLRQATDMRETNALTLQLLDWISARPRTYAEAIDAWRTSCPRLSIWEDALADGLVDYGPGRPRTVVLTQRGQALLDMAR